ncbi:hypothetical protein [Brucella tritici]|uniref:Uncharacterized protein n=1 Tax=Brucella tritici TaxID=94626 RepID=A0A6L3Y857_9HYPH|nr:hypothetical protein [Brucella tritici]KAB2674876.1 hypothetical protein F9L08_28240 [Brucella tritici]
MNKDMENTFNRMAELGGSDERLGNNTATVINAPLLPKDTCPAPAATDTGLVTVGEVSTVRESIAAFAGHMLSRQLKPGDLLCFRSQAEEMLAAKDAQLSEVENSLFDAKDIARNASSNCIYWRGQTEALEAKLAAAEKALARMVSEYDEVDLSHDEPPSMTSAVMEARAVLGGKPS